MRGRARPIAEPATRLQRDGYLSSSNPVVNSRRYQFVHEDFEFRVNVRQEPLGEQPGKNRTEKIIQVCGGACPDAPTLVLRDEYEEFISRILPSLYVLNSQRTDLKNCGNRHHARFRTICDYQVACDREG